MKIKILETIKDYEGKELTRKEEVVINGKPELKDIQYTVREAIESAINSLKFDPATNKSEVLTTEVRNKIYQINTKLYSSSDPDFTVNELAFIKERADIGFANNPLIYGRINDLVEGVKTVQPETQEAKGITQ